MSPAFTNPKKDTRPRAYRIRRMLELIRDGMKSGQLYSAGMIAKDLGVSWHTVIRDLNVLRDDDGAPLDYDASRKGFVLRDVRWQLPPVHLTRREVFAFSVATRMLQPFRGTPLELDLTSLFEKIASSLEGSVTLSPATLSERITLQGEDFVPVDRECWLAVAGYIQAQATLSMRYTGFSGSTKTYRIRPVHLVAYHGNWYVVAFRADKSGASTFALSRIRGLREVRTALPDPPESFDLPSFLSSFYGMTGGGEEMDVHVRFSPGVATYVGERIWHKEQRITRRRDGSLDLQFKTRGWKELVRWILSWQPDVEVLAPPALRVRIQEKLTQGLERMGMKPLKNPRRA